MSGHAPHRLLLAVALCAALNAHEVRGQDATRFLTGRVVDASTGASIADAVVSLSGPPEGTPGLIRRTATDDNGEFGLIVPASGVAGLSARKSGYTGGRYGQLTVDGGGGRIYLGSPATPGNITLRMWRMGALAGVVLDERGEAIVAAPVVALRWDVRDGREVLTVVRSRDARSDDRGTFRFPSLRPGRYSVAVEATLDDGFRPVFRTTFSPGTHLVEAAAIFEVPSAGVVAGVVIAVDLGSRPSMAGRVIPEEGARPPDDIALYRRSPTGVTVPLPVARTIVDADGNFEFANVPAGDYRVRFVDFPAIGRSGAMSTDDGRSMAFPSSWDPTAPIEAPGPTIWADAPVTIGTDPVEVLVRARSGSNVTGALVPRPGDDPLDFETLSRAVISATPLDGSSLGAEAAPLTRISRAGEFRVVGLPAGRYGLGIFAPTRPANGSAYWIESGAEIEVGAEDLTGVKLVVADLATSTGTLSGMARDRNARPPEVATVYVFPRDRTLWMEFGFNVRLRATATNADGAYQIQGIPPGEYLVAAVAGPPPAGWRRETFLASLASGATETRIIEQTNRTLNLTVR